MIAPLFRALRETLAMFAGMLMLMAANGLPVRLMEIPGSALGLTGV